MKANGNLRYFPRCEFSLANDDDIAALISQKLSNREPASIIRLGDGEGAMLARPGPEDTVLWTHVSAYFGSNFNARQPALLADALEAAILSADVVGVRDDITDVNLPASIFDLQESEFLRLFKKSFKLRKVELDIPYAGALRLAHLHRWLATQGFGKETVFCSAWLHFHLSATGALVKMIRREQRIGLISSKPSVANEIKERLNVEVDYYEVPERSCSTNANGSDGAHYPNAFNRIMESLKLRIPGQLFLVGAGVCGKVYCQRIKELGGIGLDIGAVCDTWLGIPSRPLVLRSMFAVEGGHTPEKLVLRHQVSSLNARSEPQ